MKPEIVASLLALATAPLQAQARDSQAEAEEAVATLANDRGAEGRALARQLYRDGLVSEPRAKAILHQLASAYGWR